MFLGEKLIAVAMKAQREAFRLLFPQLIWPETMQQNQMFLGCRCCWSPQLLLERCVDDRFLQSVSDFIRFCFRRERLDFMTFVDWCLLRSLCGLNPKPQARRFLLGPPEAITYVGKLRIAFWWFGLFAPDWASKFLSRRVGALLVADGECWTCHLTTRKQVYDRYIIHIQTVIAFSEKKLVEDNAQDPLPIYNFEDIIDDGHHTVEGQNPTLVGVANIPCDTGFRPSTVGWRYPEYQWRFTLVSQA